MCASSHCVDGYCCDTTCNTTCYACDVAGSEGTCSPSPSGDHDRSACAAGTGLCKQGCDGAGHCVYPSASVACGQPQSCADGTVRLPDLCDGSGGCTTGTTQSCNGYQCEDAINCGHSCTTDAQCASGFHCSGGVCYGQKANGASCVLGSECSSRTCIDTVCCDAACDATCSYCNFASNPGHCQTVPDGQDPRHVCQASSGGTIECAGSCSAGQCRFPDVGTNCGLCAACDGTGRCTATPTDDSDCGTISCDGLSTTCRVYQDLTSNRCAALGACSTPNDPATCTAYTDLPCTDGGQLAQDSGGIQPGEDGGTTGNKSGGCSTAPGTTPTGAGLLLLLALSLVGRRRREP